MPPTLRFATTTVLSCTAGAAWLALAQTPAAAQSAAWMSGVYVEAEGQAAFGASNFDIGLVPLDLFGDTVAVLKRDDGDGLTGGLAIGYAGTSGWSAALRYRYGELDDSGGPVEPAVIGYIAGDAVVPGGFPVPLLAPRTEVRLRTSTLDLELGRDVSVAGVPLHVYGAVAYADFKRDAAIIDDGCGCETLTLALTNTFHGVGPKLGVRGVVPLAPGVGIAAGASFGALFGRSKFKSELSDVLPVPLPAFATTDDRVVATAHTEAGLVLALGTASLTLGYRIDAMFDAFDTDQRVSSEFAEYGVPPIGDRHDDVVTHGPFARFTFRQ